MSKREDQEKNNLTEFWTNELLEWNLKPAIPILGQNMYSRYCNLDDFLRRAAKVDGLSRYSGNIRESA